MGVSAGVGMMGVGTGLKAFGQVQAGNEQDKILHRNADIADAQAQDALTRGKINEKKMRRQTEQTIGSQRVNLAAQGVEINSGSALDTQADAAYLGELDAKTIQTNAKKEAWGYKTQADNLRYQGRVAKKEGDLGAFNTILGGAGSMLMAKYGK